MQGATGARGFAGDTGTPGGSGSPGAAGQNGRDGATGPAGFPGPTGKVNYLNMYVLVLTVRGLFTVGDTPGFCLIGLFFRGHQ